MKKLLYLLIFFPFNTFAQIETNFYVNDVQYIEYLTVNFCVDSIGNTTTVSIIPEKTTYKNDSLINEIIDYRKSIVYGKDSKIRNNCNIQTFYLINSELKNCHLKEKEFAVLENFKTGKFKYEDPNFKNVIINRTTSYQFEVEGEEVFKYTINWLNPNIYILTFIDVSKEEYKYLIGEKIEVEIIKVISADSYIYKSNLKGSVIPAGIINKMN